VAIDSFVGICLLIALGTRHPVKDVRDDGSDIDWLELEFREVADGTTIVKVRDVNKVPAALPVAAFSLNLVGEDRALHEWEVSFVSGDFRV
jgi:hypothetical protein